MTEFAVTLKRTFAAPRARVYRALLDPKLLARWMSPDDHSVALATVDERVGGSHRIEMIAPDGSHHAFDSIIEELVPDERIVLTFTFVGEQREETLLTLTLRDVEGGTELQLDHQRITLRGPFDDRSVNSGWSQALTKLQALFGGAVT